VRERAVAEASEALARMLRPGDAVLVGNGAAEPDVLIDALIAAAPSVAGGIRVIQITTSGRERLATASGQAIRLATPAPGRATRQAITEGRAELIVDSLGLIARQILHGTCRIDGVLLRLGPEEGGWLHPGLAMDLSAPAFDRARFRMVEIDSGMPRIPTRRRYEISRCDHICHRHDGPGGEPPGMPFHTGPAIAAGLAECIAEQATLEVGLGRLGALMPSALAGRSGLALHTGLIGDEVMELVERGIVSRPAAPDDPAVVVTSVARGSAAFYRWCDGNPALRLAHAGETHDPMHLARLPRFTAVNGALQVDLMGNANSMMVGGRLLGGLGGALDYAAAGAYAAGSVIALEAAGPSFSRIVPRVEHATIPAAYVTHVVTEFGVASLRGLSIQQRASAMIAIAHPDHRAGLRAADRRAQ